MNDVISAAEANRSFSRLLREMREEGRTFVVTSHGKPAAKLVPCRADEAMEVATAHRLAFWDAVMLAAAAQANCRILLSEGLQDGFTWRGVTVRNPFAAAQI